MDSLKINSIVEGQEDYEIVDELPTELKPDTLYFVKPKDGVEGKAYISSKDGKLVTKLPTRFIDLPKPPIIGHWHCDQNILYCNAIPIATGNVSVGFDLFKQKEVLDWICNVLNTNLKGEQ